MSPWYHYYAIRSVLLIHSFEMGIFSQPGVDDADMTQLVEDKVDAFWKAVEGGASKRGQVSIVLRSVVSVY